MLYKHSLSLSIFGLCNFLRSSLSLFIDETSRPGFSFCIFYLFILVVLTGHIYIFVLHYYMLHLD